MYILTQEEYNMLLEKREAGLRMSETKLQELCTKIANEMPVKTWMNDGKPTPWNCILTEDHEWYCDECPVQKICPNKYKSWSK